MSPTVLVMAASWQGLVRAARNICDDEAIVIDVITVYMIYFKKNNNFLICLQLLGGGDLKRIINISYLQEFIKPRTNEMMAFRTFEQKGLGN